MVGYEAFSELSLSHDSDERGHAAHLAALAYLDHFGPADERAALYAALIGFLDDTSVKVRAALAYGLLHSTRAPRPVMLALLRDSAIISRAVLQYSPVLVDADLFPLVRHGEESVLVAISQRGSISTRLAGALLARGGRGLALRLLRRKDVSITPNVLDETAQRWAEDAGVRGALLGRADLPGSARLVLVRRVTESLTTCRLVKGSLAPERLARLVRDGTDTALAAIGEAETDGSRAAYVQRLVRTDQVNTRLLLHSLVTGRVLFFSACVGGLAGTGSDKVYTLLEAGSRAALVALFSRCGLDAAFGGLLVRLVMLARSIDLADDVAARHYVVTALTEELIDQYEGDIPEALEEIFGYLNEQNITLARKAAQGVMAAFAGGSTSGLPCPAQARQLHLPAA
ncbi:DUF2336 domain-containing protein [Devosia sp. CAU 1758]